MPGIDKPTPGGDATPKRSLVPGHTLRFEGAPLDELGHFIRPWGGTSGEGRAECSCGERSSRLPSAAARKRWHQDHKATVTAAPVTANPVTAAPVTAAPVTAGPDPVAADGGPLAVIHWPEDDPYRDPAVFRAAERFWWHESVALELERLAALGHPAACAKALAGNLGMAPHDVTAYLRQMLTWGELIRADPLHDFEPDTWVALAPDEITRRRDRAATRRTPGLQHRWEGR